MKKFVCLFVLATSVFASVSVLADGNPIPSCNPGTQYCGGIGQKK